MPKIQNEENNPVISEEMLRNCKREISHYGFSGKEYESFLESVGAMKDGSVLKYPNEEINAYRDKFIKGRENSLNDALVFDKVSKIKTSGDSGHAKETGYFCPRSFWDFTIRLN